MNKLLIALALTLAGAFAVLLAVPQTLARPALTRILFIYGSSPPGAGEAEMIRTNNTGRNGYSQLADLLASQQGHNITELNDLDPALNPLRSNYLSQYDLVVLGSNNRTFAAQEAGYFNLYVQQGGSVLALSDSQFGASPNRTKDLPGPGETSDNSLLAQFGMEIHHDNFTLVDATASRFITPTHPILSNITSFRGEGVSLIRRIGPPAQILVSGANLPLTNGQQAGPDYAIAMIATVGRGRVAAIFDRNTFFNAGVGSDGTDLSQLNNRQLALNLFDWLTRKKFANQ